MFDAIERYIYPEYPNTRDLGMRIDALFFVIGLITLIGGALGQLSSLSSPAYYTVMVTAGLFVITLPLGLIYDLIGLSLVDKD